MTDLPKAYTPHDVEGAIYERWLAADVFAPDGAGSTADPALPPFTIIQPPPNITGSLHLGHAQRTAVEDLMIRHARMRGHRALFLPGLDHASIAAQFVLDGILAKEGESRPDARARALPRADARVRRHDPRGDALPAATGRRRRPTGAACATRWTRVRPRPSGSPSSGSTRRTSPIAPRRSSTGARAAGRASATSRSIATPETGTLWSVRYHLIDPATGAARPGRDDHDRHDPARRRSSATPRWRSTPTTRATGRSSGAWCASRSSTATSRSSPTTSSTRRSGPAPSRSRPAHDHDDHETGLRHGLPAPTILADDGTITATGTRYDGLDRFDARAAIVADLEAAGDLVGRRAARDGHRALPAQQRHHRAAAQDAVVHPDDAARGTRARGDPQRADPDPPRAIREDLGALADQHPRLERLAPAVVGPPHPRLVLPGRPRDGVVRRGGPGRLRRLRPARRRAPAGPRHLRHVVQLGAVAVLDPGLAGRHARLPRPTTRRR